MWFMKFDDACGRFSLYATADGFKNSYGALDKPDKDFKNFDISPANRSPVIYSGDDGKPKLELMQWGFELERKTPPHKMLLFNTRSENAFKGFWKSMTANRRALIPATGYFEWTKPPKSVPKQKFYYHPKQMDLFSFAGVWSNWKDKNGKEIKAFSIITTEPNKEAAKVHNRMPVILRKEDEASYLDPSKTEQDDILPFLLPYKDNGLEVDEVSVNTKAFDYNDPGLIAPLKSA
jgi:putative SOS response-associated peptidase YedK